MRSVKNWHRGVLRGEQPLAQFLFCFLCLHVYKVKLLVIKVVVIFAIDNIQWVLHFHSPLLLSEYVQEIGRAGRDGTPADVLTLVSEPTGWLDPEDRQRRRFFEERVRSLHHSAQQLVKKLPPQGEVDAVARQFPDGAIALSLLHSAGQLNWLDPFHYSIVKSVRNQPSRQLVAAQQMTQYLTTKQCRWQFLLSAFGFDKEAAWRCGHCDNCRRKN